MNVKGAALLKPWSWVGFLSLSLAAGCAERVAVVPKEPLPPAAEIAGMGFSIQVGAFTDLDKAIRLTRSLEGQGVAAYYFRHDSGFFKVRFGNFPSRENALKKAESLLSSGIIEDYYIVGLEEYAVAKARLYGTQGLRDEIVRTSENFIGLPYQWGGDSSEQGFDCSGLTMAVYQLNGLDLPRTSGEQWAAGRPVDERNLSKGDLVFFATRGGAKVSHVGIYLGGGTFLHAPSRGNPIQAASLSGDYYRTRYLGARSYF